MRHRLLPRPTYANVMATAAMFVALGGTSYAVTKLPKDSVGSAQLRKGSVTASKLAKGVAVSGPQGPAGVRGPRGAEGAPGAVPQPSAWQNFGLENGWTNFGSGYQLGGFRKDASGTVQLRGVLKRDAGPVESVIATLPPGYRPAVREVFAPNTGGLSDHGRVDVLANGQVLWASGATAPGSYVSLSGISFTAEG
ncbi:MAG: hypothetical protein JHD16_07080 [Solirubrobacteraceae bacterium]|nr:hypothetical protein [Solirubrobacteraceae bacterium]